MGERHYQNVYPECAVPDLSLPEGGHPSPRPPVSIAKLASNTYTILNVLWITWLFTTLMLTCGFYFSAEPFEANQWRAPVLFRCLIDSSVMMGLLWFATGLLMHACVSLTTISCAD